MTQSQFWAGIVIVIVGYVLGFYFQHRDYDHLNIHLTSKIDGVETHLSKRIDDLRSEMTQRFNDFMELLKSEIQRVEDRIERLEHPVTKS